MAGGPGSYWIGEEEKKELMDVIEGGYLFRYGTDGVDGYRHKVLSFEREMAQRLGHRYVVATNSGTSALQCCLAALGIVDQRVNGFLEHAFFVSQDDFRSAEVDEMFQTVVAVDNTAVEVIEVRSGETATRELDHGTEVRRDNRKDGHDHPFRFNLGVKQTTDDLKTFGSTQTFGFGVAVGFFFQLSSQLFEVDFLESVKDSFGAHTGG